MGAFLPPSPGRKNGGKCFVDVGPVSARQCKTGSRVASVACEALNSSGGGATWPAQGALPRGCSPRGWQTWGGRSSPPPAPLRMMNGATLNYFKGGITQAVVSKRRRFTRRPGKQHGKIISINSHPSSRAISKHNLEPRHYCFSTSSVQLSDAHWMNMMPLS